MDTLFSVRDKVLVLRLTRLGRLPPALYASEILAEEGFPVLAIEYGNVSQPKDAIAGKVPRLRLATRWVGLFPRRARPALIFLGALARLSFLFLTQGRPRLMISHGLSEQVMALVLCRLFGTPYVAHVHEVFSAKEVMGLNRLFFALEGIALRRAVFLIFPEKKRAEIYRQRYRLRAPCEISANCPRRRDPDRNVTPSKNNLRAQLGLRSEAVLLGYFGGLGRYNALDDAIRAVARIPKLCLLLWGWGDKTYLDSLRELASGVGAGERILFLGELPADKWSVLEELDLSFCVYEPGVLRLQFAAAASNKLMESLAAGVPVITSGAPDFRELVEIHDVGICLSEISVDAIAGALRQLLSDRLGLKRRAENGRRCHELHYHYESQFQGALGRFRALIPPSFLRLPMDTQRIQARTR